MAFQWAQLSLRVKQAIVVVLLVAALCLAWGITQLSAAQTHMHHAAIATHTQVVDSNGNSDPNVAFK